MGKISVKDETGKFRKSYRKWSSMCRRCYDPRHPAYKYYGEKGVKVDDRWLGKDGYQNFFQDMGEPPEGLTLERKDRDKNYQPDNCRWATWREQALNRSNENKPQPDSLKGKARKAGLPYAVVYHRIKVYFWSEEKALTTPNRGIGGRPKKVLETNLVK